MAIRIRKDVWKLSKWDPVLVWYAKAVEAMKARPFTDPTSWAYQAAMHGYDDRYPEWQLGQPVPPQPEQDKYWAQCQHSTWFFLPWHRMYLAYFEQIVADTVKQLGGPDWALPYWNYSDATNPKARALPQAFVDSQAPGLTGNPLQVARRVGSPSGKAMLDSRDVSLRALSEPMFEASSVGGSPGFGGGAGMAHFGQVPGLLELLPHNAVHGDIGGLMQDPTTAGLDPIFWLHHANIDRLWEVWLRSDPNHANPTDARWLDQSFDFHASDKSAVVMNTADVLDTTTLLGGYSYDGLPVDQSGASPAGATGDLFTRDLAMARSRLPELVGATAGPLSLASAPTSVDVAMEAPIGVASFGFDGDDAPEAFLNFENVTGKGAPPSYDVYINLPAGAVPRDHEDLYAGVLAPFGVAQASVSSGTHAGDGVRYVLPITEVVDGLQKKDAWDPSKLTVTLVPRRPLENQDGVDVGRISVFFQ